MKHFVGILCALACLFTLSACEYYKLEDLRTVEPTGTPFQKALWSNYRAFSMAEEKDYDWSSAVIFANKALNAAYGQDVEPEMIENWDVPTELLPQLQKAREDLLVVLATDAKLVQPQLVADAQTSFDCWLEQQEEGWQVEDIARCRDGFEDAIRQLSAPPETASEVPMKPTKKKVPEAKFLPPKSPKQPTIVPEATEPLAVVEPKSAEPEVTAEPKAFMEPKAVEPEAVIEPKETIEPKVSAEPKAKETETASYIVFFQADDITLAETAKAIVDNAAQSVTPHATYRVIINAHTDNSGSSKLDPELPSKRAGAIKNRLIENGVKESAIEILAKGETGSKVLFSPTPVERQVEIFITE